MERSAGLVSIVVPCFDAGDTLTETVDSALRAGDCEVVVVDDGSRDPLTLDVLADLPSDVRLVRQENAGLPAARNAGIAVARGEFVLPLDADDLIDARYPAEAREVLTRSAQVGIVYCRAELFGAASGPYKLPDFSLDEILLENCIFATAMFRKADWHAVGGYNERMRRGREDHDFWLRLLGLGREVVRLDGTYFFYRIRPGSMNTGYSREEYVEIYSEIFRDNAELYLRNIEAVMRHRFSLIDRINDYEHRFAPLERLIDAHPRGYAMLRRARRAVRQRKGSTDGAPS
jgi:glycosyltransferase involved in cell wall biosynthesis